MILGIVQKCEGHFTNFHIGQTTFSGRYSVLVEAYTDAVKKPYGYLVIDMSLQTEDKRRLRTRIFPGEDPIIYVPKV